MNANEDALSFPPARNLELADKEANGVQLTPPGLPVPVGKAAEFMSKDCVTVREGVEVVGHTPTQAPTHVSPTLDGGRGFASRRQVRSRPGAQIWPDAESR